MLCLWRLKSLVYYFARLQLQLKMHEQTQRNTLAFTHSLIIMYYLSLRGFEYVLCVVNMLDIVQDTQE